MLALLAVHQIVPDEGHQTHLGLAYLHHGIFQNAVVIQAPDQVHVLHGPGAPDLDQPHALVL